VYKEDWNQNYDPFSLSHRFLKIITRLTNHDLNMKLNTISINCTFVKKKTTFFETIFQQWIIPSGTRSAAVAEK